MVTLGDDWIEPGFQTKSLLHQVLSLLDKVGYAVIGMSFTSNLRVISCGKFHSRAPLETIHCKQISGCVSNKMTNVVESSILWKKVISCCHFTIFHDVSVQHPQDLIMFMHKNLYQLFTNFYQECRQIWLCLLTLRLWLVASLINTLYD